MDTTITLAALALADLRMVHGLESATLAAWGSCEWVPGIDARAGGNSSAETFPRAWRIDSPRRTAPAFPPREVWQSFELLVDDLGLCATPAGGDTRCAA